MYSCYITRISKEENISSSFSRNSCFLDTTCVVMHITHYNAKRREKVKYYLVILKDSLQNYLRVSLDICLIICEIKSENNYNDYLQCKKVKLSATNISVHRYRVW